MPPITYVRHAMALPDDGVHPSSWHLDQAARAAARAWADRMAAVVSDVSARAVAGPVVVVSHGLALSVHLGHRLGADFDRESFWSRLAFPDAWALGPDEVLHRSLPRAPIS